MSAEAAEAADFFSLIEIDEPRRPAPAPVAAAPKPDALELDMTTPGQQSCTDCGAVRAVDERGRCEGCASITDALVRVAAGAAANAAVHGGELRGVGFSSADGFIAAIRNGVPARTHAEYLTALRSRFGMTSGDLAALDLPGPMAETSLPVGTGIKHVPTGPSVFDRPVAERQFRVGDAATGSSVAVRPGSSVAVRPEDLTQGKVVAVVESAGNGCVIAWRGARGITRGVLRTALEGIGRGEILPRANSARAQAGRACGALNSTGLVVRADRERKPGEARYLIASVNHSGDDGDAFGRVVATATLAPESDRLLVEGREDVTVKVTTEYQRLLGEEVYQSADVTAWLSAVGNADSAPSCETHEARAHRVVSRSTVRSDRGYPQVVVLVECPFCLTIVRCFAWSLGGRGKRCPSCPAKHATHNSRRPIPA